MICVLAELMIFYVICIANSLLCIYEVKLTVSFINWDT